MNKVQNRVFLLFMFVSCFVSFFSSSHWVYNIRRINLFHKILSDEQVLRSDINAIEISKIMEVDRATRAKSRVLHCGIAMLLATNDYHDLGVLNAARESHSPYCYLRLAKIYERQKAIDYAKEMYNEAIKNKPDIYQAHRSLASIFYREGEFQKAISYYVNLIQIDSAIEPNDYFHLSRIYRQTNQIAEARELINLAMQKHPEHPWIVYEHAKLLVLENREQEAIGFLQKLIENNPAEARFYYSLCRIYYDLGELSEAAVLCKESTLIDPAYSQAYLWTSKILLEQELAKKALAYAQQCAKVEQASGSRTEMLAHVQLGDVYFHLKQFDKSGDAYCHALIMAQGQGRKEYILGQLSVINRDCQ